MTVLDEQQQREQEGGAAPEPEAPPREKREYVVLVRERPALLDDAAIELKNYLNEMEPGQTYEVTEGVKRLIESLEGERRLWSELGVVSAFNRAGALEEVERQWPAALEGRDVGLHLIPMRFWTEITPEEDPPPPPRRRWKGV